MAWRIPRQASPVEMEIRDEMQKIAAESPVYGYRRITAELRKRGFAINRKRAAPISCKLAWTTYCTRWPVF
jgi:hypothetical protein